MPLGWDLQPGMSVALNGACLTVREIKGDTWETELMQETLDKTSFNSIVPKEVNAELPMRVTDRLGGHIVQGHVDTTGKIEAIKQRDLSRVLTISYPQEFHSLLVPKGSVAVDGVSLTVVQVKPETFSVELVDYTLSHTTLGSKKIGDLLNLEFDILAKYITHYGAT